MDELSSEIKQALNNFELSATPFDERDVARAIRQAIEKKCAELPSHSLATSAECMAFDFYPDHRAKGNSWGTYYGPWFVGVQDSQVFESPSLQLVTAQVLDYWMQRAQEAMNPVLRNRYADLVWDLSPKVRKVSGGIIVARQTIDSALEIVARGFPTSPLSAKRRLSRALTVALSINDQERLAIIVKALLHLEESTAELSKLGTWGYCYELLVENKRANLSGVDCDAVVAALEAKLRIAAEPNADTGMPMDPFAAEKAALLLSRHYSRTEQQEDKNRVLLVYSGTSLRFAQKTSAMVGVNRLRETFELLKRQGLNREADVVAASIRSIGPRLQEEMEKLSHEIVITDDDAQGFKRMILEGGEDAAILRIVQAFIPRRSKLDVEFHNVATAAPLSSMIRKSILDSSGRTIAIVGSLDEDPDGQRVLFVSQYLQLELPWLHFAMTGWIERYSPTPESFSARLLLSELFPRQREHLLSKGFAAYLAGDHAIAAHLWIPQIENALRTVLELVGRSVYSLGRHSGLKLKSLGDCLADETMVGIFGQDVIDYLSILLTDARGYNMRNNYCHGLIHVPTDLPVHTHRLAHIMLLLSLARVHPAEAQSAQADQSSEPRKDDPAG